LALRQFVSSSGEESKKWGFVTGCLVLILLLFAGGLFITKRESNQSNNQLSQSLTGELVQTKKDISELQKQLSELQKQLSIAKADNNTSEIAAISQKIDELTKQQEELSAQSGPSGVNGANGSDGAPGQTGPSGAAGVQGIQGPSGTASCPNGTCVSLQSTSPGVSETGNINVSGTIIAGQFSGSGSALTSLNGSNISSGTVANARLVNSGVLTVTAGTGLSGGGSVTLGASTTINLANTAVTAGTYGSATSVGQFMVDAQGRIINASNIAISGVDSCSTCVSLQATTPGTPQTGNINVSGTIIAGQFSGNGSALTSVNGSNIASGTLADARLSSNVPLKNAANTFTANQTVTGNLTATTLTQGTNAVCDNSNNCNYASTSGSANYIQNGTTPQTANFNITGDGTIGGNLSVTGNVTATTLNATTGINTGAGAGTQRLDASGNLVNIGTITSGLINGQTISSSANFTGTVASASTIQGTSFISTIATGTAPLTVTSTTNVANLNADLLDGLDSAAFQTAGSYVNLQGTTPGTAQTGNINVSGAILGGSFNGDGTSLTNLNASNVASGTLSDSRLSTNVAVLNGTGPQTFTGNNKFTGSFLVQNAIDSTTAFQVQNAGGSSILSVNTSTATVTVTNLVATVSITTPSLTINGGTPILGHLSTTSANVVSAGVAATACANYAVITVTGAAVGDTVQATPTAQAGGIETVNLTWNATITAANTVTIRACNPTLAAINTADTQTWRADVWKH